MKKVLCLLLAVSLLGFIGAFDVRVHCGLYMRAWHMAWNSQGQTGLYGDATYYEFPGPDEELGTSDDKNLLLDGGNSTSATATVGLLLNERLNGDPFNDTIYFMALSSAGADHYNGLKMAVDSYYVLNYYENVRWPAGDKAGYDSLIADIDAEGANVYYYNAGDWLSGTSVAIGPTWGSWTGWDPNITARVLAANFNTPTAGADDNEWAGVILIKCGETGFLTGGDHTTIEQEAWIEAGDANNSYAGAWNDLTHADFYKVGQHGSTGASSPTFMNRMAPAYAIVEVAFGSGDLPSLEALDACYDAGAIQYRTDHDYVVQVMVDDSDNYEINRWLVGTAAPDLVTGLTVDEVDTNKVVLSWSDASYDYDVYRSKFSGGDPAAGTATQPGVGYATGIYGKLTATPISYATYTDTSMVDKNINYYYVIASIATTNTGAYYTRQERRWSNEVSAFVPYISPTPTPVGYKTVTPTPSPSPSAPLLDEGFDNFHLGTRPAGWTFVNCNSNSDTYTTAGNYGGALPSLKLDATGDKVVTKTFSVPDNLYFWIKVQGVDATSALLVEEYYSATWNMVTNIGNLPTTGTTEGPFALNGATVQLQFTYTKSVENLAFDNVRVTADGGGRQWTIPHTMPTLPPLTTPVSEPIELPPTTPSAAPEPTAPPIEELLLADPGDYDGDGIADVAIFQPAPLDGGPKAGLWTIRGLSRFYFGGNDDLPVSGDYDGDGTADIAIFRPAPSDGGPTSGLWSIRLVSRIYYGSAGDDLVPGDYDGDGACDIAIFRSTTGLWAVQGLTKLYFGIQSDQAVPGDYDGDGTADIGFFRSSTGLWKIKDLTLFYLGAEGDIAVPGDYAGSGLWTAGVFRPASGLWAIRGITRLYFGVEGDQLVPGDYNGDLADEPAIFRESVGLWAVEGVTRVYLNP